MEQYEWNQRSILLEKIRSPCYFDFRMCVPDNSNCDIIATLKRLDVLKLHELELSDYVPFGDLLSTYLPPLLILAVNLIILLL